MEGSGSPANEAAAFLQSLPTDHKAWATCADESLWRDSPLFKSVTVEDVDSFTHFVKWVMRHSLVEFFDGVRSIQARRVDLLG